MGFVGEYEQLIDASKGVVVGEMFDAEIFAHNCVGNIGIGVKWFVFTNGGGNNVCVLDIGSVNSTDWCSNKFDGEEYDVIVGCVLLKFCIAFTNCSWCPGFFIPISDNCCLFCICWINSIVSEPFDERLDWYCANLTTFVNHWIKFGCGRLPCDILMWNVHTLGKEMYC